MAFTVKVDDKELQKLLNTMQKRAMDATKLMTFIAGDIDREVAINFRLQSATPNILSGPPGDTRTKWAKHGGLTAASRSVAGTSGIFGGILQDSGQLRASVGKIKRITRKGLEYGTPLKSAAIHMFGGVIKPKKAQFLTLPYPGITGRARDYTNTFFAKKTLFQKTKTGFRPLFMLKKRVKIPARPFLTVPKKAIDRWTAVTAKFITGEWKGGSFGG